jgi:TonB family protein
MKRFDLTKSSKSEMINRSLRDFLLKSSLLILLFALPAIAQPNSPLQDEEFLPSSKTHLRGRRLDPKVFEQSTDSNDKSSAGSGSESQVDIKSLVVELKRAVSEAPPPSSKSGTTFKDVISNIRIEGKFEVVSAYTAISDNYIRTIELTIRSNIFPPIIARTMPQSATVSIKFLVLKDGTITNIEKEASTGSTPLDATAINACRSSSPLPKPEIRNLKGDEVLRMRFVLTFNPTP